jgi:hypothetical protein
MREKVPAQSAISDCKAANWSSSGAGFVGTGNEGCHPAGACTVAAGAVVAGWRSCSSNYPILEVLLPVRPENDN